jgi:hypothetical protein
MRPDFCLLDLFRFFDVYGKEKVSLLELNSGLNDLGVFPNRNDLALVIKAYDVN